jgi:Icc-related predicted phosphoesterase
VKLSSEEQLVLVTHMGPSGVSTSVDWKDPSLPIITTGSDAILSAIIQPDMQTNIVVNIHGHAHHGVGQNAVGSVRIVNPGSAKLGDYGYISFDKNDEGRWVVTGVDLRSLPNGV